MNAPVSKRRRPLRVLLVAAGIVVALIALAWGALGLLFPPARVRTLVQQQLSRSLNRDVRFADAALGLFPPVRLTVRQLAISEPGGFANGAALRIPALRLDLDAFALLSRRVVVRHLELVDPGLHLLLRADGTTNLDGVMKPSPPSQKPAQAMDFTVDRLVLRRARLLVDDLKVGARRTLTIDSNISLATHAQGGRFATSGATRLSQFAFGPVSAARLSDLNTSLAKLTLTVDHDGVFDSRRKRLALSRLDLGLGRARLGVVGVIDDPGARARLDLHARGERIDFGEVLAALAAADARALHGVTGSGRLDFDLAIRGGLGPDAAKTVTGLLAVTGAALRYPGAPARVEALAFTARFAPDSLWINDLTARVQGQPVRGRLAMTRFHDPIVSFAVQGNVDLAAVAPLVAPKDTRLAGRAALDLNGRGRAKDPGTMALGGTAVLSQVSVESPLLPKRIEGVNGRIEFDADRARVAGLTARAGSSSLALDANVTRPLALLAKPGTATPSIVEFKLRSPRLDLAEVLPPNSGPPIVLNAIGVGNVAIDRLINQKLDVAQVRGLVRLSPGVVESPQFSMKAYGGDVLGVARFDLLDPANPKVSLRTKVDSLSADALLSAWTPARNLLQGSLSSGVELSVAGGTPDQLMRTLSAVGVAHVTRGQLGPGPVLSEIARVVRIPSLDRLRFDDAKLPFHVERGRIVNDAVVLRGGFGEWRVAGTVSFDGSLDYAVSATLPPAVTEALHARSALAAGALTDPNGNLLLDLRITGTGKSPRVSWDVNAMKDRVLGNVSQALEAQQQKLERELRDAAAARQQAAADSARRAIESYRQAIQDSLRRRAGDVLRGFFGGGARDTTQTAP